MKIIASNDFHVNVLGTAFFEKAVNISLKKIVNIRYES